MHPPGSAYTRAVVERDITVDGVRSLVKQAGDERSGEAVVFVHGNPGPSDDWDQLLPAAGAIGRAVALDMPGYGRAQRPRRGLDPAVSAPPVRIRLTELLCK